MALKSSMSWLGLGQVAAVACQFVASVVLARFLTPHDMGIYAVAAATVGLLTIIQAFGLQSLIVREKTLSDHTTSTAFTINVLIDLALAAGTALLSLVGGRALGDDGVRHVMLALSLGPLIGIFDFLPAARLERLGRFKVLALASIAASLVGALVNIAAAIFGARYMSAAYAGWASAGVYALVLNFAGREFVQFKLSLREWRYATNFGLQMLATAGLHAIGGRISDVALGKLQGLSALGIYGRASNLNGILWNNIHLAVGRVMFVDFATIHRSGESLRNRYIVTVDVVTALLWPAFAGMAVLAGPLIRVIYGQQWLMAAQPMAMLAVCSMVLVSMTMTWEIFTATGNLATQTRIEFINAIQGTVLFILGGFFGLTAAAAARIVSALIALFVYRPHLDRMTDTRTSDFIPIYIRSFGLTVLAAGPAFAVMAWHHFSPSAPIPLLISAVALGGTLWAGALLLFKHRLVREVRRFAIRAGRPEVHAAPPIEGPRGL